MRMPKLARSTTPLTAVLFAAVTLLGACSAEVTSPAPAARAAIDAPSMFVPDAATKALIGVVDGTYSVTFDPTQDQVFSLGPNRLVMPANSVCNMATSGYGTSTWNNSCSPHRLPIVLTVVIKNAASARPKVDFYPAMRFNPTKTVQLFMYSKSLDNDKKNWVMKYCPDRGACVDESLSDSSLQTYIDRNASVLFRRIKHFSGYVVAERGENENEPDGLQ